MDMMKQAAADQRAESFSAIDTATVASPFIDDEEMVADERSEMRPAQMLEHKISNMTKGDCTMVSNLRLRSLIAGRA